ncbi:glycosyltransferase [uncultured Christiangramia sp.]|uniref:glycosyltransferase n=1 Tax=uncultured Christiangramia sp. TaxID=503836 RepID=UPI00260E9CE2|nr:glycosyltransferase [uncultured Christiangramia sp.]
MKVLQVIDTLDAGGAERMAVNCANALAGKIEASHICCTRREGLLRNEIKAEVGFLFLNKRSSLDLWAFRKLLKYVKKYQISIVHAHSTSIFLCTLLKIYLGSKIRLIWHDHYGKSEFLENRPKTILKLLSGYIDGVIAVNQKLAEWSKIHLKCSHIQVIRNFILPKTRRPRGFTLLKGSPTDFKFICVANLRPQKDHISLLEAFEKLDLENVSLHLLGKSFQDDYSVRVLKKIENSERKDAIFYYGSQEDVDAYLNEADVAILSSISEGLPLALLECGFAGLPVIYTKVGQCPEVMGNYGLQVPPSSVPALSSAMKSMYLEPELKQKGLSFRERIELNYSAATNVTEIIDFYTKS